MALARLRTSTLVEILNRKETESRVVEGMSMHKYFLNKNKYFIVTIYRYYRYFLKYQQRVCAIVANVRAT